MSKQLSVGFRLWIEGEDATFMGEGRANLLQHIHETGSINEASRRMGISYKKALKLIDTMNALAPSPLVVSTSGGLKGGGSVVTERGMTAIATYRDLKEGCSAYLEQAFAKIQME
jgi:molybdate transport system regulatory protein